jgi:hypothetical protein
MPAWALASRDGPSLVEATQCLFVAQPSPSKHMVSGKVGLDVVLNHGLIGGVAAHSTLNETTSANITSASVHLH